MNAQFNQADKVLNVQGNKQAIARVYGIKKSEVAYLSSGLSVDTYKVLYDRSTQTCWLNTSLTANGTVNSWAVSGSSLTLITSAGTFVLNLGTVVTTTLFPTLNVNAPKVVFKVPYAHSVSRTQNEFNSEWLRATDWDIKGDGVTLDDAGFAQLESDIQGAYIDLLGRTYSVTAAYSGNKYANGTFKRADGTLVPALYHSTSVRSGRYIQAIGQDALFNIAEVPTGSAATNLIAIGPRAMYNNISARNNYAIGYQALYSLTAGVYNTAFGFESMLNTNGTGDGVTGSRNSAYGDNTMRFNTTGYNNMAFGRNAAQTNVSGSNNINIGAASSAGDCPIDLYGNIINTFPTDKAGCVGIGTSTLYYTNTGGHTAIGMECLQHLKKGSQNTAVGYLAGKNLEVNVSPTGKVMTTAIGNGTYVAANGAITITQSAHGYLAGSTVKVRFTSGPANLITTDYLWLPITYIDANTYSVSAPSSLSGSGVSQVTAWYSNVDSTVLCEYNVSIGYNSMALATLATTSTAVGVAALRTGGQSNNTAIGFRALSLLGENGNQIRNTALGARAMELMQDGSDCTDVYNSTAIGYMAYVSGSSQVQLGNSATTTYVYGTVQNRSDARDKDDIEDLESSVAFVRGLRSVSYRWDMREDYRESYEVQIGIDDNAEPIFETRVRELPRDGSKKRIRKHVGYLAQEVKELMDKLGIEFGGYQDHTVDGGADVLSLGYDEFIPHATKAISLAWDKIDEFEARIAALEGK